MASFIVKSSATLAHPYFYIIRTNTQWSLCLLSGLSPTNYSALLLECELVSIHTSRVDRSKNIRLDREKWIDFLNQYGLREEDAEFTDGAIKSSVIFDDLDDAVGMSTHIRLPLLRVGKVRLGKSPPSNTAINSDNEPPRLSHAMCDVKMRLIESTMSLLVIDEAKREDVSAVEQWVLTLTVMAPYLAPLFLSFQKKKISANFCPLSRPRVTPTS